MTWFKVDDGFYAHPKVAELEESEHYAEALSLWLLAGSWAGHQLTDGRVPTRQLRRLVPFDWKPAADALIDAGLWVECDGAYQFHDWDKHQPKKDEVERRRAEWRDRKRRQRGASKSNDVPRDKAGQSRDVTRDNEDVQPDVTRDKPDVTRDMSQPVPRESGTGRDGTGKGDLSLLSAREGRDAADPNGYMTPLGQDIIRAYRTSCHDKFGKWPTGTQGLQAVSYLAHEVQAFAAANDLNASAVATAAVQAFVSSKPNPPSPDWLDPYRSEMAFNVDFWLRRAEGKGVTKKGPAQTPTAEDFAEAQREIKAGKLWSN